MARTGIALDAAMLAALVGIDGLVKRDIGGIVRGDDTARLNGPDNRPGRLCSALVRDVLLQFHETLVEAADGCRDGTSALVRAGRHLAENTV